MIIRELLTFAGYQIDSHFDIWHQPNYESIKYSDGEEVEQRILTIIQSASDLSVLSTELRQHCTDWPSTYHLSSSRANLLRPFEQILKGSEVLEIGAGCGAITRYLGEAGANVLALEGTIRRASIARSRTRDLKVVEVVAENFSDFRINKKFDFITLIGVLEYANLYMPGENPAKNLLDWVMQFLKPGGSLIIAIENQLGLKYFAGANEDHVGIPMYGIEGRYQSNQVQTFGRAHLQRLLSETGFRDISFFAPFPDYKLPCSIISEAGFNHEGFDAAALAWQSVHKDPQLPKLGVFCQELAWPVITQNKLGMDLANSFLVRACPSSFGNEPELPLAWHFSTSRKKEYCKETRFVNDGSDILAFTFPLGGSEKDINKNPKYLIFNPLNQDKYINGTSLFFEFIQVVSFNGFTFESVSTIFKKYLQIFEVLVSSENQIKELQIDSILPGRYFDCLPHNIIGKQNTYYYFDAEWEANFPLEAGYVLYRSILSFIHQVHHFSAWNDIQSSNLKSFIKILMSDLGWTLSEERWNNYLEREVSIQLSVSGHYYSFEEISKWFENAQLESRPAIYRAMVEREGLISRIQHNIVEQEGKINQLNYALDEREEKINTIQYALDEREEKINTIQFALNEREEKINTIQFALDEREEKINNLNKELANQVSENINLHQKIEYQLNSINQLKDELKLVHTDSNFLKTKLIENEDIISNLSIEISNQVSLIESIKKSKSWRITEPLRFFVRILRF